MNQIENKTGPTFELGLSKITPEIIQKISKIPGPPMHPFLLNGLFSHHRDFDVILEAHASGKPFYIYTGRGPSSGSMHLGHLVPFMFASYLQSLFKVPVIIQITDDEKMLFRGCSLKEVAENSIENIRDILACGFNPELTFIFKNTDFIRELYPTVLQIQSKLTNHQVFATFGITEADNIGQTSFCAIQAAPSFPCSLSKILEPGILCLIIAGKDQDPYFRLTREVAGKLGYNKPSLIYCGFVPSLQGTNEKMSSTVADSAIFLTDSLDQVKSKIKKSFSGGGKTREEQQTNGANLQADVAYQYLCLFDTEKPPSNYGPGYEKPKIMSAVVKDRAIEVVAEIVKNHQENRRDITDEIIEQFMTPRKLVKLEEKATQWDELCRTIKTISKFDNDSDEPEESSRLLALSYVEHLQKCNGKTVPKCSVNYDGCIYLTWPSYQGKEYNCIFGLENGEDFIFILTNDFNGNSDDYFVPVNVEEAVKHTLRHI